MNGTLYRGSKPVMWSVVEKTALAEAEVEYQDYQSDTIWVKFPVMRSTTGSGVRQRSQPRRSRDASLRSIVGQRRSSSGRRRRGRSRAIARSSFSSKIDYGLYEVTAAPDGNWAKVGDKSDSRRQAGRRGHEGREGRGVRAGCEASVPSELGDVIVATIRLQTLGYDFRRATARRRSRHRRHRHRLRAHRARPRRRRLPDLDGERRSSSKRAASTPTIPFTVDADGVMTKDAPGFDGQARPRPRRATRATPTTPSSRRSWKRARSSRAGA